MKNTYVYLLTLMACLSTSHIFCADSDSGHEATPVAARSSNLLDDFKQACQNSNKKKNKKESISTKEWNQKKIEEIEKFTRSCRGDYRSSNFEEKLIYASLGQLKTLEQLLPKIADPQLLQRAKEQTRVLVTLADDVHTSLVKQHGKQKTKELLISHAKSERVETDSEVSKHLLVLSYLKSKLNLSDDELQGLIDDLKQKIEQRNRTLDQAIRSSVSNLQDRNLACVMISASDDLQIDDLGWLQEATGIQITSTPLIKDSGSADDNGTSGTYSLDDLDKSGSKTRSIVTWGIVGTLLTGCMAGIIGVYIKYKKDEAEHDKEMEKLQDQDNDSESQSAKVINEAAEWLHDTA